MFASPVRYSKHLFTYNNKKPWKCISEPRDELGSNRNTDRTNCGNYRLLLSLVQSEQGHWMKNRCSHSSLVIPSRHCTYNNKMSKRSVYPHIYNGKHSTGGARAWTGNKNLVDRKSVTPYTIPGLRLQQFPVTRPRT